jgi:hypothetical protein
MIHLPTEIINYCLEYADTGTKLVYNPYKQKMNFIYDISHPKYSALLRLLSMREIQIDQDNHTHIHLPWLAISQSFFFVGNIIIKNNNNIYLWNTQKIYVKESETNKKSYCFSDQHTIRYNIQNKISFYIK